MFRKGITVSGNRIILGIIGGSNVPMEFIRQMNMLHEQNGDILPVVSLEVGSYPHRNRTVVVRKALQFEGWDYLLFVDTDMMFPGNLIERVKEYTDPVVGGMYFGRTFPDLGPCVRFVKDEPNALETAQFRHPTSEEVKVWMENRELHDVGGVGTGCMAIRRDVLQNWPQDLNIFNTILPPNGENMMTEDIYFCWRCLMRGIQPKLDSDVVCGHVSQIIVDENVYLSMVPDLELVGQNVQDE